MSKTLNEIRETIDKIDNDVHDLLMQRAALVTSVAAAKQKEGLQIVQPAREARMIRRLLRRHEGPLPSQTVVRIWRELVGSVALLQTGLSVCVVSGDKIPASYWDMAKDYFGSVVSMQKIHGSVNAAAAVRDNEVSFAVLPWPEFQAQPGEDAPWWVHLFDQRDKAPVQIICALPFVRTKNDQNSVQAKAIVISKFAFLPSDQDNSFVGLVLDADISRAKIMERAKKAGLPMINVYSAPSPYHDKSNIHMIEVQGYFEPASAELAKLKKAFVDKCLYCDILGGYPVMPEISLPHVAHMS